MGKAGYDPVTMMKKLLSPDQVVTLADFPVHNGHILKIYFRMCQGGAHRLVPPCPVMRRDLALPFLQTSGRKAKAYNALLAEFIKIHPRAEYVLLDGSHRTTAATLTHKKTVTIVLETDKDVREAEKLLKNGELFSLMIGAPHSRIQEAAEDAQKHFLKHLCFQTVQEKTERMVREKVIPEYMIRAYRKM